jgi:cobalt-zinc-cadmium efflux system protein
MEREKKLLLILAFNLTLMVLEIAGGIISNSLALLSDAGHMLTDSLAIFLSYLAIHWSRRPADHRKTYGYHRAEILVALANGVALLLIAGYIFYEAVLRFFQPQEIKTGILLAIATIGLAGNLFGLFILKGESHENLNIRSAFFHILADTLSSVGVIVGGVIITLAVIAGAFCQAKALTAGCEGISRNPASAGAIRGLLILGLVLIETLVIYALLITIIILMVQWGKYV